MTTEKAQPQAGDDTATSEADEAAAAAVAEAAKTSTETEEGAVAEPEKGKAPDDDKPKKQPWFKRRIAEETYERHQATERARQAEARAAAAEAALAKAGVNVEDPAKQTQQPAERTLTEQEIDRRADQKAVQKKFDDDCEVVYNSGKTEYPDFEDRVGDFFSAVKNAGPFLGVVVSMPNAHRLLHHLGNNPDEAQRIAALSPVRAASELTRLEMKLTAPKKQSKAPNPIEPVSGSSQKTSTAPSEKDSMAEWMRKRSADLKERRGGRRA